MSYWNNRVWQCEDEHGRTYLTIKETYYNDLDEVTLCDEAAYYEVFEESVEDLKENLERMLRACDKEVLIYKDFKFASFTKGEDE